MKHVNGGPMNEQDVVKEVVKDPTSYSWISYGWVLVLAMWGGAVSYIQKVRSGKIHKWSFTELVGELVTSGLIGVLTFWLCEFGNLPPLLTAAFVGISGHMGARGIFLLEQKLERWFGKIAE